MDTVMHTYAVIIPLCCCLVFTCTGSSPVAGAVLLTESNIIQTFTGHNVTIPCISSSHGSYTTDQNVTLYKQSVKPDTASTNWALVIDNRITKTQSGAVYINSVTERDTGTYRCMMGADIGHKSYLTVYPLPRFIDTQKNKSVCNGEITTLRWSYTLPHIIHDETFPEKPLEQVWLQRSDLTKSLPNDTDLTLSVIDDVTYVTVVFRAFFISADGYTCVLGHAGVPLLNHTAQVKVDPNAECWPLEDSGIHILLMVGACAQALLVLFLSAMFVSCIISIIRDRRRNRFKGEVCIYKSRINDDVTLR